jgi:hypothetical protein
MFDVTTLVIVWHGYQAANGQGVWFALSAVLAGLVVSVAIFIPLYFHERKR